MRKFLKILWSILVVVAVTVIAAALLMQSPKVQTKLLGMLQEMALENLDGELSFSKVHFRPFNAIVIKDLAIVDSNPAVPSEAAMEHFRDEHGNDYVYEPYDTLFRAKYIVARLSLKNMLPKIDLKTEKKIEFGKGPVVITRALVRDGRFNLVNEEDKGTNLQRMFGLKKSDGEMKPETDKEVFEIKHAELKNMTFSMCNIKEKHPSHKGGINWCDLYVYDINVDASDVKMSRGIMSGTVNKASLKEISGLDIHNLTASTAVGRGKAIINDIHIVDAYSDINVDNLTMSFKRPRDLSDFTNKIRLDGEVSHTKLASKTLQYFVPALEKINVSLYADGEVHGTVNDLKIENLDVRTDGGEVSARLDGKILGIDSKNCLSPKEMTLDMKVRNLKTDTKGVERLLRNVTGKNVDFSEKIPDVSGAMNADISGPLNNLCIISDVATTAGELWTDIDIANLTNKKERLKIDGVIKTDDLDVSKFMSGDLIKQCSLESTLHASLRGEEGPELTIDTLRLNRLNVKDYDYSKILATGTLTKQKFNGRVISQDPNFNFLFQGIFTFSPKTQNAVYQFYANVGHADLHAMNLDPRENATMSFVTSANFNKTGSGMMLGNIAIHGLRLTNDDEVHKFSDINVISRSTENEYRVNLNSGIASGAFIGSGTVADFARDIVGITGKRELPALFKDSSYEWSGNSYMLNFKCLDTRDITSFFKPGLYIDNNTRMELMIDRNGILDGRLSSHRLAMREKYIKDLILNVDNKGGQLSGKLTAADINVSALQFMNNSIQMLAENNNIGLGIVCDGDANSATKGEIFARGDLSRNSDDVLGIHADILPSSFSFNTADWSIMPAGVDIESGDINIHELNMFSGDQSIKIDGGLSSSHADTLGVDIENIALGIATAFLGEKYEVKGNATGIANVISYPGRKNKGILLDLLSEDTSFADTSLGNVEIESDWDDELNLFNLHGGNGETFNIAGTYTPSMKDAEIDVQLRRFKIGVIKPLLTGVFTEMDGTISSDVSLSGPLSMLEIKSSEGYIHDTRLTVDFTKVPYIVDGPFRIDENGLYFDGVSLKDMDHGTGKVNGKLTYDHFKDIVTDLHINANNAQLINIPEKDNVGFYGNLVGNGTISITGPLSMLTLEIDAQTTDGGNFHVPISGSGKNSNTELLTFKEAPKVVEIDPYEEMMNSLNSKKKSENDMIVKVHAKATPSVNAYLELDKNGTSGVYGQGNGLFDIEVRPSRGIFNLKGDYTLSEGTFLFNALGLAKREFTIQEGSNVKFNGDVMDTDLDIDAIYKTKASIARLISDTTSVNTRRVVECGIQVTDKLSNPSIGFSINIPDLEPTIKSKVENALSTEDKVQRQLIALLISNNFLPDEQSGVNTESTGLIYSGVTNVFTNQLNNILQKLDIPLDFDMRYQQTQRGNDIFDVAVSTQLFNNRVLVNGNIGNRQYNTSGNNSEVVGDLDIEVKLDKNGAIRVSAFSHSADQYTNYLDNSQRNGVGITFQQEFNNFFDMLTYTFASRSRKEEINAEEDAAAANEPQRVLILGEDGKLTEKK